MSVSKFKFKTIKARMLFYLLPSSFVLLLVLFAISYLAFKGLIDQEIRQKMNYKLDHTIVSIENALTKHSKIAVTLARTMEATGVEMTKGQYQSILAKYVNTNGETLGAGVWFEPYKYRAGLKYFGPYVYRDKENLLFTEEYSTAKYDYPSQDWYKMAVGTTEPAVWSVPYLDNVTGITMVTTTAPFYDQNKRLLGVTTADINLSSLQKMIRRIKIGLRGRAFLLDKSGLYLADQNTSKIMKTNIRQDSNKTLAALSDNMLKETRAMGEFVDGQGKNYVYYASIPETQWILAITIPQKELYQPLGELLFKMIVIILLTLGMISFLVLLFSSYITKNLQKVLVFGEAIGKGDLTQRINTDAADEIGEMAAILEKTAENMRETAAAAQEIAAGNLNTRLQVRSEEDVLNKNLNKMIENIKSLVSDINMLAEGAVNGQLSVRAEDTKHRGDFQKIVHGINRTLEAIIQPFDEGIQILQLMSVNDYTVPMKPEKYQGKLRQFAEGINTVRSRMVSVQDDFVRISKGDMSKLEELQETGKRSDNDRLTPAVIMTIENIKNLIDEVERLSKSAVAGELKARGHATHFEGGYRQIIHNLNLTLNAIVKPVHEASIVLQEMAKGNLDVQVRGDYQGDHALLAQAVNHTVNSFNEMLGEIYAAAEQVTAGSSQIATSSQNLSQASTEQAVTMKEINASVTEIANQTKENAVHAKEANTLSLSAKEQATSGNARMTDMLTAMGDINESSVTISKIIKVIDEIAFQTNILALNAAVEAARAGQHGKGFAVVAEEVRNLAARSADAAKETTVMIETSVKKVENGTKIASETAAALHQIVESVSKAASLVGQIATASKDQAIGIVQINEGINQVSQVTQTSTATAEQSAAASQELTAQAETLKKMVARFALKSEI